MVLIGLQCNCEKCSDSGGLAGNTNKATLPRMVLCGSWETASVSHYESFSKRCGRTRWWNNSKHLLCGRGYSELLTQSNSFHFFITTLWGGHFYCSHLVNEETEVRRAKVTQQGHTTDTWWNQTQIPGSEAPESRFFTCFPMWVTWCHPQQSRKDLKGYLAIHTNYGIKC